MPVVGIHTPEQATEAKHLLRDSQDVVRLSVEWRRTYVGLACACLFFDHARTQLAKPCHVHLTQMLAARAFEAQAGRLVEGGEGEMDGHVDDRRLDACPSCHEPRQGGYCQNCADVGLGRVP